MWRDRHRHGVVTRQGDNMTDRLHDLAARTHRPCPSVYPPSATGPYSDERGWSGPLRCVMTEGHGERHWNTGINWTDQPGRVSSCDRQENREFVADVLHDCLSSFQGLDHGEGVCCFDREAAVEYLLSPASGLRIEVDE